MSLPLSAMSGLSAPSEKVAVLLVARRDEAAAILRMLREKGCAVQTVPLAPIDQRGTGDAPATITRAVTGAAPEAETGTASLRLLASAHALRLSEVHHFGDVTVDVGSRKVTRQDRTTPLSTKEFDLLVALLRAKGAVLTRQGLMRDVWRREYYRGRTLDSHICSLRRKVEQTPSRPRHILTVAKVGFRLDL